MARGGEVFILDMGKPIKIIDLAFRMARLRGFNPILLKKVILEERVCRNYYRSKKRRKAI